MQRRTCLLVGYYGANNLGDEILLKIVGSWLEQSGYRILALSHDTATSSHDHPTIHFVPYGDLYALFDAVRRSDVVLMGGGGPLHEYNRLNPEDIMTFPGREVSAYVQPLLLANQCGLPIGLIAQGVGPLFTAGAQNLVSEIFNLADIATVRSENALHTLRKSGNNRAISIYPDPGWLSVPFNASVRAEEPLLVIEVRAWPFESNWEVRLASSACQIFSAQGWRIRYCCFGGSGDVEQAYRLAQLCGDTDPEITIASLNEIDAPFQGAWRAITMRFHAAIVAIGSGVPTCLLAYDEKVSSLHSELGADQTLHLPISSPEEQYLQSLQALRDEGKAANHDSIINLQAKALGHCTELNDALLKIERRLMTVKPEDTCYGMVWQDAFGGNSAIYIS